MKEFRKTQTIEVVKQVVKGEPIENQLPGQVAEYDGYLVQNKGQDSDRWVIPTEVFYSSYEPVKNADYAVLTPEQREVIRTLLESIFDNLLTLIIIQGADPNATRDRFFNIQRRTGEEFKTFNEKTNFLESELDKTTK